MRFLNHFYSCPKELRGSCETVGDLRNTISYLFTPRERKTFSLFLCKGKEMQWKWLLITTFKELPTSTLNYHSMHRPYFLFIAIHVSSSGLSNKTGRLLSLLIPFLHAASHLVIIIKDYNQVIEQEIVKFNFTEV